MKLSRQIKNLDTALTPEIRKAAIKFAAALCACRAKVAGLEAENCGQREALLALNRHDGLARDFTAIRHAERDACAQLMDRLSFCIGAKAIRERA